MPRSARIAPIGLAALIAAAAASVTTALAFDKVDQEQPIAAGRGYVYFVREVDVHKQPLPGRTVTISVGTAPGPDASVAPSDAGGHLSGPAGKTASQVSGADGFVHFVIRTSTTPGSNQFLWTDTAYTGEVLVTGTPPASPAPSPRAAAAAGTHGGAPPASHGWRLPSVPPLAAGIAAMALVWLVAPPVLARRRRRVHDALPVPSLSDRLPTTG